MIKIVTVLLPFLREIIFGRNPNDSPKPPMGRFKKYMIYAVIVGSFAANYIMVKKVYSLTLQVIQMREQLTELNDVKQRLATAQSNNELMMKILSDKVNADKMAEESEVLKQEAKVLDKAQDLQRKVESKKNIEKLTDQARKAVQVQENRQQSQRRMLTPPPLPNVPYEFGAAGENPQR